MKSFRTFHNNLIKACKSIETNEIERNLNKQKHEWYYGKPLLFACSIGNKKIVELMIKHGADVNKTHKNGKNALTVAFEKGHNQLFDFLISRGVNFNCPHGFRLLLEDCKRESASEFDMEFLLKHGAPQNGEEPNGMFPLIEASQNGFTEKVRLLLKNTTVDVNKKNTNGLNSLHLACTNNHEETVCLLIGNGANVNSTQTLKYLIERGVDLNAQERILKMTGLMIAIKGRHFEIVRILIENKVDLNLTDEHGNTSLMLACYELDVLPSVQLMFEQNILIDLQNKEGKTALMIALHKRHLDMVRVLIEHGSNLDLIDSNHNSALMFAIKSLKL